MSPTPPHPEPPADPGAAGGENADAAPPDALPQGGTRIAALLARTLQIEADALAQLAARQDEGFAGAVGAILACRGRVVVMGIGKSGHVGRKIAATLASTGTPAFFVHPAEASHGDLGMVTADDIVLAVSNSGETDELVALLPAVRRLGVTLVAMTGRPQSTLARAADWHLSSAVEREACPLNLAPTASTTAQMALGDALAVVLLDARGFVEADFARSHPGGALGRRLLVHVRDLMRTGDALPVVPGEAQLPQLLRTMSAKGLGFALQVDGQQRPVGIFTDGDLRRLIEAGTDLRQVRAADVMHASPRTIRADALAAQAAQAMESWRVTGLAVVDGDGRLAGAINSNDLMRAKVI